MNKQTIFNSIKIITLGLLLSGAISHATTPIAPPTFPGSNPDTSLDVSATSQLKLGALGIGSLGAFMGTTAANLYGDASVVGQTSSTASNLFVSGKVGIGTNTLNTPNDVLEVKGNVRLGAFDYSYATSSQSQHAVPAKVCADTTGKLVACPHNTVTYWPGTQNSNFVVPDGVFKITVNVLGGGGGGGGISTNMCGTGGGSGGTSSITLNVLPGQTFENIFAGAGGSHGVWNGVSPKDGGDSQFSNYIVATGGKAGGGSVGGAGGAPGGVKGGDNGQGGTNNPSACYDQHIGYGGGVNQYAVVGNGDGGNGFGGSTDGGSGAVQISW